jgi:hypothetical protein
MKLIEQTELSFSSNQPCPSRRRVRRAERLRWWFARMHEAVERATIPNPPTVRPSQEALPFGSN